MERRRDTGQQVASNAPATTEEANQRGRRFQSVVLIVAVGLGAIVVVPSVPAVNAVVVALLAGLLIVNLSQGRVKLETDVSTFVLSRLLQVAVILLGAGIDLTLMTTVGSAALVVSTSALLAVLMAATVGARLGLTRRSSFLIGLGTGICGGSAILAVAPIVGAKKDEIGVALATIFGFNALALLAYPLIGHLFALNPIAFGTWAGVAVHDTASAVATGFAAGSQAGEVATLVKLTRTLFLVPVVAALSIRVSVRHAEAASSASQTTRAVLSSMPWFVLGFALLAVLNSFDMLAGLGSVLNTVGKYIVVFVVGTIGLTLRLSEVASLGHRLFYTGFATSLATGAVSLGLIEALSLGQ